MKKYLLGITAIVLAIGFSAFTKPVVQSNKFATYRLFTFDIANFTPTQSNVQDVSKYIYQRVLGSADAVCDQGNRKPCEIAVNDLDTKIDAGTGLRVIDAAKVSVTAALGNSTFYVVSSITPTNPLPTPTAIFNKSTN